MGVVLHMKVIGVNCFIRGITDPTTPHFLCVCENDLLFTLSKDKEQFRCSQKAVSSIPPGLLSSRAGPVGVTTQRLRGLWMNLLELLKRSISSCQIVSMTYWKNRLKGRWCLFCQAKTAPYPLPRMCGTISLS